MRQVGLSDELEGNGTDAMNKVFFGDCRDTMRDLIAQGVKVQMCVTSPPYFGLRDYGHAGQLGLEATPAEFVAAMVEVFALVRELLADDVSAELSQRPVDCACQVAGAIFEEGSFDFEPAVQLGEGALGSTDAGGD